MCLCVCLWHCDLPKHSPIHTHMAHDTLAFAHTIILQGNPVNPKKVLASSGRTGLQRMRDVLQMFGCEIYSKRGKLFEPLAQQSQLAKRDSAARFVANRCTAQGRLMANRANSAVPTCTHIYFLGGGGWLELALCTRVELYDVRKVPITRVSPSFPLENSRRMR